MLGDISTPEAVERERRSVAMLTTGAAIYNREEALAILEAVGRALAALKAASERLPGPHP